MGVTQKDGDPKGGDSREALHKTIAGLLEAAQHRGATGLEGPHFWYFGYTEHAGATAQGPPVNGFLFFGYLHGTGGKAQVPLVEWIFVVEKFQPKSIRKKAQQTNTKPERSGSRQKTGAAI